MLHRSKHRLAIRGAMVRRHAILIHCFNIMLFGTYLPDYQYISFIDTSQLNRIQIQAKNDFLILSNQYGSGDLLYALVMLGFTSCLRLNGTNNRFICSTNTSKKTASQVTVTSSSSSEMGVNYVFDNLNERL